MSIAHAIQNFIFIALPLVIGLCTLTMILAMWYKGDLKPTRLRKLINKWRNK